MPRSIVRTITTAIAITALAAPTALARPADTQPFVARASTTAHQAREQDFRAIAARDDATRRVIDRQSGPPTSRADSTARPPLPGPPTWPVNSRPIASAPAAKVTGGGNGGVGWTTIALGIAGSLLAIAGIGAIASRTRRAGRARIAA